MSVLYMFSMIIDSITFAARCRSAGKCDFNYYVEGIMRFLKPNGHTKCFNFIVNVPFCFLMIKCA